MLAFPGFVGYGELWLFSPLKSFLALCISNLLFSMGSYLSFETFWSYWKTYYLGGTLDLSQGSFSTVQRLMSQGPQSGGRWITPLPGKRELFVGKKSSSKKTLFKKKQIICIFIWLFHIMQWGPWGILSPDCLRGWMLFCLVLWLWGLKNTNDHILQAGTFVSFWTFCWLKLWARSNWYVRFSPLLLWPNFKRPITHTALAFQACINYPLMAPFLCRKHFIFYSWSQENYHCGWIRICTQCLWL